MNEMDEKVDIEILKLQAFNKVLRFTTDGVKRTYDSQRDYLKEAIQIAKGEINMIPERQHLRELYEYYEMALQWRKD